LSAAIFLLTAVLVLTSILSDAAQAFADGLLAASPNGSGTFTWAGVTLLQSDVHYTMHNGQVEFAGGALTPLAYVLLALGAVAVGRLWRLLPGWRRSGAGNSKHEAA
jgi:hypothetical protein